MAFRLIRKDSVFSSITIFGLSVSMAACLLIFQYSFFELSYDRQLPNARDLYRVATVTLDNGEERYQSALTTSSIAPALQLLAGRNFETRDFPGNHFGNKIEPVILNRRGVEQLGYTKIENAIGQSIFWGTNKCVVVGVVDDFHQESLKNTLQPILFTANMGPSMTIKLTEGADQHTSQSLAQIRSAWNFYFPNNPFDYFFLEDAYDAQYASDKQIATLFHFFCLLALLISCLGLFALSLFSITQRTKEISIRKVLGASVVHLIRLLTTEYLLLVLIAAAVALPISYWGVTHWLQEFAFHIEISMWHLAIPVGSILSVALMTVGAQTIKVVMRNPTDSLKHE